MIRNRSNINYRNVTLHPFFSILKLSNQYIETTIISYGAIIQKILVRDKNGQFDDVITGYDNIDGYVNSPNDMHGAIVGRYANRIGRAEFMLDGKEMYYDSLYISYY